MTRFSCAVRARELGEPLYGTASTVPRWLLIEQPGPWGRDALVESRLGPSLGRALKAKARALGARPILIRRHGGEDPPQRTVFVVSTQQRGSWAERFVLDDAAEVLDLDLSPLAAHSSCGGEPVVDPLLLVCTNGRHDVCCAEFGRPLIRALAATHPDQAWECSHIGGDRFAGNLVCLPEGVYYGHLGPLEGPAAARAHGHRRVLLEHYRGRSCHSFVVQAAEFHLRTALGLDGLDDVGLVEARAHGDRMQVRFAAVGGRHLVEIDTAPAEQRQQLTCSADLDSNPPRYTLIGITSG